MPPSELFQTCHFLTRRVGPWFLPALVGACTAVGPDYRSPPPAQLTQALGQAAAVWQAALPHEGSLAQLRQWWASFNDPALSALMEAAQQDSPSLQRALAAINEARANLSSREAGWGPSVDLNANRTESGEQAIVPSQVVSRDPLLSRRVSLDTRWEIDLFGAVRRAGEAAEARLLAQQAGWHEAHISLAAEVASRVVDYRACRLLAALSEEELASRQHSRQALIQAERAGLVSASESAQAAAALAEAQSQHRAQILECELYGKALVSLTGLSEQAVRQKLDAPNGEKPMALPTPALFQAYRVPVQLLSQRPDLTRSERELAAASAEIGMAQANRYPRLSLVGSIGRQELSLGSQSLRTQPWSFGPSLSLPLFDAGRRQAEVQAAEARYQRALANYRQAVRDAVREAEESLARLETTRLRCEDADQIAGAWQHNLKAAQVLWQHGGHSRLTLEDIRRAAIAAERNRLQLQRQKLLAGINLYKALGGGWQQKDLDTAGSGTSSNFSSPVAGS